MQICSQSISTLPRVNMKGALLLLFVVCLPGNLESKASNLLKELHKAINKNGKRSAGHAEVDLHTEQFCVDISFYEDVKWVEEYSEECKTEFEKKCEDKQENVCEEVLETHCKVVPYTGTYVFDTSMFS